MNWLDSKDRIRVCSILDKENFEDLQKLIGFKVFSKSLTIRDMLGFYLARYELDKDYIRCWWGAKNKQYTLRSMFRKIRTHEECYFKNTTALSKKLNIKKICVRVVWSETLNCKVCVDGLHRVLALWAAGLTTIPVTVLFLKGKHVEMLYPCDFIKRSRK